MTDNTQHRPATMQPYLSATSEEDVTISGPPSILNDVRQLQQLSNLRTNDLPVYAPYHAAHLFSKHDIEAILETTSADKWLNNSTSLPIVSSTTGQLIRRGNFRSMLEAALEDILLRPICLENVIQGVAYIARFSSNSTITLYPLGTSPETLLCSALERKGYSVSIPQNHKSNFSAQMPLLQPSPSSRGTNARSKIAILGMSGRFPESEDPTAFWELNYRRQLARGWRSIATASSF